MTRREKQQLQKMIQKLPPKNLERAVEIIQRGKPPEIHSDEIHVNLEKEVSKNHQVMIAYIYIERERSSPSQSCQYCVVICRIMQHCGDCIIMLKQLKRLGSFQGSSTELICVRARGGFPLLNSEMRSLNLIF